MNRALFVAASGMAAQQRHLDVIADNLANADVAGFKGAVASFSDVRGRGGGYGVSSSGMHTIFEQGKLERGSGPFDVALDGPGFLTVQRGAQIAYTRAGELHRGSNGSLQTADGWTLRGVKIPSDAVRAGVDPTGNVWYMRGDDKRVGCGRLPLATFNAPEELRSIGGSRYVRTDRSGHPRELKAGAGQPTSVAFGMIERSNVSIVGSMMEILSAQRAYEANAKGVQAADEMQRIANNLHRT